MECRSCGIEIQSTFKVAIAKNECPACGNSILDEESLALIEDIENTIRSEAAVREETARNLATIIVSKYNISFSNEPGVQLEKKPVPKQAVEPQHKVAPPSPMKQAMSNEQANIVKVSETDGMTDEEREKIMEEAIREKFNMVDSIQADTIMNDDFDEETPNGDALFSEGGAQPLLERERIARLKKQQQAMNGGGGMFRRSS
jgi:hypothetical protein